MAEQIPPEARANLNRMIVAACNTVGWEIAGASNPFGLLYDYRLEMTEPVLVAADAAIGSAFGRARSATDVLATAISNGIAVGHAAAVRAIERSDGVASFGRMVASDLVALEKGLSGREGGPETPKLLGAFEEVGRTSIAGVGGMLNRHVLNPFCRQGEHQLAAPEPNQAYQHALGFMVLNLSTYLAARVFRAYQPTGPDKAHILAAAEKLAEQDALTFADFSKETEAPPADE